MSSSAIGISFVMSIPNHNFGGIGGDGIRDEGGYKDWRAAGGCGDVSD